MPRPSPSSTFRAAALLGAACAASCSARTPERPADAAVVARASTPDAALEERESARQRAGGVFACFARGLKDRKKNDPRFAAYQRNAFTDMFIFHALFDRPERLAMGEQAACGALVEQYTVAFLAEAERRAKDPPKGTARARVLAARPIDAAQGFVQATDNHTGRHVLDHEELTRAGLKQATGGREPPITEVVVEGARRPDLSQWLDLRYHAHTADHAPGTRANAINESQIVVISLLASTLQDFVMHVGRREPLMAGMHLGIACHIVQDLVLHRGLTRPQMIALMRQNGRNPRAGLGDDSVLDVNAKSRGDEARRFTRDVLALAREAVGEAAWRRLLAFSPPPSLDFELLAQDIFDDGGARSLTLEALIDHIPNARGSDGGEPVQWDLSPLLGRVRDALARGGLTLGARR